MPKRKRVRDYGNYISQDFIDKYVNVWTDNQEEMDDMKVVSMLLLAEGGSFAQIVISENELYNGIYHLKTFKFDRLKKEPTLIIHKLDDIHNPKRQDFEGLIEQLPELAEKYDITIPNDLDLSTNPLLIDEKLPRLMME